MIALERQVGLLLRFWPRPDRAARGEEIAATTLDLVPAGRRWLSLALAGSLIVGGLRARRRNRPPIRHWLVYAGIGCLPLRWHRWMLDDLFSPGWLRRLYTRRWLNLAFACAPWMVLFNRSKPVSWHVLGFLSSFPVGVVVGTAVGVTCSGTRWAAGQRRTILAENGYNVLGQPDPATGILRARQALERRRGRDGPDGEAALQWAAELGLRLHASGQLEEAVAVLADTFERAKRVAPNTEWPTWRSGLQLAAALAECGKAEEAISVAEEVLGGYRRLCGPDDLRTLRSAAQLGLLLRQADRLDQAIELLADSFRRAKQLTAEARPVVSMCGHELATALNHSGRSGEAVDVLAALSSWGKRHAPNADSTQRTGR